MVAHATTLSLLAAPEAAERRAILSRVLYRLSADAVVVVHFAFVVFVALGGFLVWRWRWVWWPHLASVVYGAGIVFIGWTCPLTDIERALRDAGGEQVPDEGFVERFIEGVVYPGPLTPLMRVLAAGAIAVSWAGLWWRRHRAAPRAGTVSRT